MNQATWSAPRIWTIRLIILAVFFGLWEWVSVSRLIDPILIGQPTGILAYLWQELFVTRSLFKDFAWTMSATLIALTSSKTTNATNTATSSRRQYGTVRRFDSLMENRNALTLWDGPKFSHSLLDNDMCYRTRSP